MAGGNQRPKRPRWRQLPLCQNLQCQNLHSPSPAVVNISTPNGTHSMSEVIVVSRVTARNTTATSQRHTLRSFSLVDLAREPSDGTFNHEPSRRRLRSYRASGQLRHSESLLLADGNELGLYDRPLKYLVGSGRFARTYLAEVDGRLVESPLSWYSSLQAWRMSPGYDLPRHSSFRRDVDADCLYCHVGRAENMPGSLSRLEIREPAIGCERCHGPASLHVSARARRSIQW